MTKYIITFGMLMAFPLAILLNDIELLKFCANDWGIFITLYFIILLILTALFSISSGSTDKL